MKKLIMFSVLSLVISGVLVLVDLPGDSQATANELPTPSLGELKNSTYKGFEEPVGPVTLVNGRWEGKPYDEGGTSRPVITLAGDVVITGDLDGDRKKEAVVLLNADTGGTGRFLYLAVVTRRDGKLENVATQFIGDRIQIRGARIQDRRIFLDVVQAGPKDAGCCPGELTSYSWSLEPNGVLKSITVTDKPGRLTLETIGGAQWVLHSWGLDEAAQAVPEVTLVYQGGRFTGKSGCNKYFTSAKMGKMPGHVVVGSIGSTKMACRESVMAIETRFLDQLVGVKKFGFLNTHLALYYVKNGAWRAMLFKEK